MLAVVTVIRPAWRSGSPSVGAKHRDPIGYKLSGFGMRGLDFCVKAQQISVLVISATHREICETQSRCVLFLCPSRGMLNHLGVADEGSYRIDARSSSPAPVLAFVELPTSFRLVRYEVGCSFFYQFASGVQECDHPVGAHLAIIRLSLLWYDDSFGRLLTVWVSASFHAQPGGVGDTFRVPFP